MQIQHVRYFVALSRERHFGRAAVSCGVTQPTLSSGIGALEAALGFRLVQRDRRFVDLTPEGADALGWAQQILSDAENMRRAGASDGDALTGCLTLGVIPAAMPVLGCFLGALCEIHAQLETRIVSMNSRQIERGLKAHEIDAGVTYLENEPLSGVVATTFYQERYLFATPREGPFAQGRTITWKQASKAPLALLTQDMQNRRILDAQLARFSIKAAPRVVANSYPALLSMVRDGGLSSILPHLHAEAARLEPGIAVIPFSDPSPPQAVGLVVLDRHPMSPLARAALRAARGPIFHRRLMRLPACDGSSGHA